MNKEQIDMLFDYIGKLEDIAGDAVKGDMTQKQLDDLSQVIYNLADLTT